MKRFPDGVESKFFFEKHIPSHAPDWVRSVDVPANDGRDVIPYAMVNDIPTLAWAANLGTIELHVPLWHAGRHRTLPARPDFMVFDLDPGEGTSIVECCEVAGYVTDELARQGLESFAKTSGSKGLQLYAVVGPKTTWDSSRDRSHEIARKLEAEHPDLVVSNMRRSLRRGRVLIDWSQNHPAKTTVAVYSVRAMPAPTVSTPVAAAEVRRCAAKQDPRLLRFETDDVLRRLDKHGDLFAPRLGLTRASSHRADLPIRGESTRRRKGCGRRSSRAPIRVQDLLNAAKQCIRRRNPDFMSGRQPPGQVGRFPHTLDSRSRGWQTPRGVNGAISLGRRRGGGTGPRRRPPRWMLLPAAPYRADIFQSKSKYRLFIAFKAILR